MISLLFTGAITSVPLLRFVRKIAIARSELPEDPTAKRGRQGFNLETIAIKSASHHSSSTPTWSASYVRQNPTRKMRRRTRISGMKRLT